MDHKTFWQINKGDPMVGELMKTARQLQIAQAKWVQQALDEGDVSEQNSSVEHAREEFEKVAKATRESFEKRGVSVPKFDPHELARVGEHF